MTALYRTTDPETSREAAEAVSSVTSELETAVYDVIAAFGEDGCIADDVLSKFPERRAHSVIPRFNQLKRKGLIVDTGLKRRSVSGRNQTVLRASVYGGPVKEIGTLVFDD